MKRLEDYENYEFESSTTRTPEYIEFERTYKNYLNKHLPDGFSLHDFHKNHFEFSCVIKSDTDEFIYLSIPDVRFFPNEWKNNILIRQMEHEKDWHGKSNYYTDLKHLTKDLRDLNSRGYVSIHNNYEEYEM